MDDKFSNVRTAFGRQAVFCRDNGSPLTADILDAIAGHIDPKSAVGTRIMAMEGDLEGAGEAVALRLAGGLHALARSGRDDRLAAAYRGEGDLAKAVSAALAAHDAALVGWLDSPPQTNEPARAAYVMAGLMVAAARYPMPIDLLEVGSSAGLVLNLNRYRYDLGGVEAGEPTSPLLLAPRWSGGPPPASTISLISQRGVDRNPVYLGSPEAAEKLIAYIWPDQPDRIERAERAIALARAFPPPIVAGEAGDWVESQLAAPQADGVMRLIFHTITLQYLPEDQKRQFRAAIAAAAARATEDKPFGWLSYEFDDARKAFELRLKLWPSNEDLHLADGHPHGASVDWLL
ncbi:MAG: DUF2332 domain-containing protein [Parasphingopyxis sp.]